MTGKKWEFFVKANINATAGLPISMLLNVTILPPLMDFMHVSPYYGAIAVSGPYYVASVVRQYTIDFVFWKWAKNIDPSYWIKKALTSVRRERPHKLESS